MTNSTERLFDTNGNLVVPADQPIPDGLTLKTFDEVNQAPDAAYPAGLPDGEDNVNVFAPAVTSVPLHTPAEQALVDAGHMAPRETGALSAGPADAPADTPVAETADTSEL